MKIEISLLEVQEFLANGYNKRVGLKYVKEDTIEIEYFASILLTIKEVTNSKVVFHYEMNGLVDLLAKGAKFLLEKKIDDSPIEWDTKTDEVIFYLYKVEALSTFLKTFIISQVRFVNENIVLVCNAKFDNDNKACDE